MQSKPTRLRLELMREEALSHLDAAEALNQEFAASHRILALLGFELLLKLVYECSLREYAPESHNYSSIFSKLPGELRKAILDHAYRHSGPIFEVGPEEALKTWSKNFVTLRYPYEKYSAITRAEYEEKGHEWLLLGANTIKADFRFYPNEMDAMIDALKAAISLPD